METISEIVERLAAGVAPDDAGKRVTRARCRVCDDAIVEARELVPESGDIVMGGRCSYVPAHVRVRYYCSGCGIRYQFIREESVQ